jgi:hypothetical protein
MYQQKGLTLSYRASFRSDSVSIRRSVHFLYVGEPCHPFTVMLMSVLGYIASLIVRFLLANKAGLPAGWAARLLIQCGVQFAEIWDVFNEMYESQVRR